MEDRAPEFMVVGVPLQLAAELRPVQKRLEVVRAEGPHTLEIERLFETLDQLEGARSLQARHRPEQFRQRPQLSARLSRRQTFRSFSSSGRSRASHLSLAVRPSAVLSCSSSTDSVDQSGSSSGFVPQAPSPA